MHSTTSLTAAAFTLSTLFLSATANPILARQSTYSVSCPSDADTSYLASLPGSPNGDLEHWCTSQAVSLVCDASGKTTHSVDAALRDPHCDVCTCVPSQPPPPPYTYPVSCPNDGNTDFLADIPGQSVGDLTRWCSSPAVSLVCDATAHPVHSVESALKDPHCDVCTCEQPKAGGEPPTPEKPTTPVEVKSATTPKQLQCGGTVDKINPNLQEGVAPFESQFWCTKPEVNAVCDAEGLKILGEDILHVCKAACKCA